MKIVSWNCNGALRKKLEQLCSLDADLYIVQECEDPSKTNNKEYSSWANNYRWVGNNKNKGLGIFAKEGILLNSLPLDSGRLEYFLPVTVNDAFTLLAVWTREANSPTFKYIGQMWKYLQQHKNYFHASDSVIIGDFNSNACWDAWDRWWNHSDVVREFEEIGIVSLYHLQRSEEQGKEREPTFYMYKKPNKPYHIDYAFVSKSMAPSASIDIGTPTIWLHHSDHMPLVVQFRANSSGSTP
jgi:exonuclease III